MFIPSNAVQHKHRLLVFAIICFFLTAYVGCKYMPTWLSMILVEMMWFSFVVYWFVSATARNRLLHALKGNGSGKGKGKGRGNNFQQPAMQTAEEAEQDFLRSVAAAMPEAAKLRAQSQLLPEEWNTEVVPYQLLSARGGIAKTPKQAIPAVLSAVGYTGHATAILITQDPDEVGLRAYPRSLVTCSFSVAVSGAAREINTVTRWLVQLGFSPEVERVVAGTEFAMAVHMQKMTAHFSVKRGWPEGAHPAKILLAHICHVDFVDKVLSVSGMDGIFLGVGSGRWGSGGRGGPGEGSQAGTVLGKGTCGRCGGCSVAVCVCFRGMCSKVCYQRGLVSSCVTCTQTGHLSRPGVGMQVVSEGLR